MPNIFFGKPKGEMMEFDEHETEHMKVVRVGEGEKVEVTDGKGIVYKVILRKISKKKAWGDILEAHRIETLPKTVLSIYIGSSSWERLRFLIEKAVELGADRVILYKGDRSKRDYAKKRKKIELVIRDAAKQCKRYYFPVLKFLHSTKSIPDRSGAEHLLFLDPAGIPLREIDFGKMEEIGIIVGPEGGFSEEEKKFLMGRSTVVSLGNRILRFETAGIVALSIVSFMLGRI